MCNWYIGMSFSASNDSLRSLQSKRQKERATMRWRSEAGAPSYLSASLTDVNNKSDRKSIQRCVQTNDGSTQTCEALLDNYISERFKDLNKAGDACNTQTDLTTKAETSGPPVPSQLKSILKCRPGALEETLDEVDAFLASLEKDVSSVSDDAFSGDVSLILDESCETCGASGDEASSSMSKPPTASKIDGSCSSHVRSKSRSPASIKKESSKTLLNSTVSSRGKTLSSNVCQRSKVWTLGMSPCVSEEWFQTQKKDKQETKTADRRQKSVKWNQEIVKVLEYSAGTDSPSNKSMRQSRQSFIRSLLQAPIKRCSKNVIEEADKGESDQESARPGSDVNNAGDKLKMPSKNMLNTTMKIPLTSMKLPLDDMAEATVMGLNEEAAAEDQGMSSEVYEGLQLTPSSCEGEQSFLCSSSDERSLLPQGNKNLSQTERPAKGPSEPQDLTGLCLWLTLRAAMQLSVQKR
ncbi:hypothetical protein GUITHDRAFT_112728 [Guillardia theta CCMP2712]|uniref:Uncharacterized protein n=1 Tax=Guillardia theta (strain CCMP2712) TaxID=905079 RepID=L1IYC7_GUITC|nr:hypothetical protein GUITHDRAFT_112728 [Guillardia theta CCMP2712]EKX41263.1 hypothetical protein GUITHDRAFT_112728 [Guillardia theta CCMP2712]|eukprot:XP_005828243.1 hypothetical protein GUITHDRAFT_112728 [Guillardia theta CCMP2712]